MTDRERETKRGRGGGRDRDRGRTIAETSKAQPEELEERTNRCAQTSLGTYVERAVSVASSPRSTPSTPMTHPDTERTLSPRSTATNKKSADMSLVWSVRLPAQAPTSSHP
eukprot:1715231-Rhodomonas_salina.1